MVLLRSNYAAAAPNTKTRLSILEEICDQVFDRNARNAGEDPSIPPLDFAEVKVRIYLLNTKKRGTAKELT